MVGRLEYRRDRHILCPRHTYRSVGNVGAVKEVCEPQQAVGHPRSAAPDCEHYGQEEAHEGANGHHQWPVTPAVGHDCEDDGHDELDSVLRSRDDVDQLDAVAVGPREPEGEGADGAGWGLDGR